MSNLDTALAIAIQAHAGQVDKAGQPYILHPLRLMFQMATEEEMITAVLHDVVEDSDVTLDALRQAGFSEKVITAVAAVSRQDDETYEEFIRRLRPNALAAKVKLADLTDNMDARRLKTITPKDLARIEKYHHAWIALTSPIDAAVGE
ncbi:MAG: HD domain-containing protein [Chloroflexi bacterium]|nr:HD domain-containing protein [Chloroflexota bacterium]MBK8933140.1 HD domain-containing protein [Chloroflexota bacterium]